ncbi:MAG: hypothetical protein EZS28_038528 [Streblomastix strix]|uniref:Uncharacterized protein n=1 Tax=Streblomastix strix TaxID=222440 RepID=A0A5J4U550_9EUKA|nr:MAG: hypothetical protein EZS28_038528 [Streblomastix strix]
MNKTVLQSEGQIGNPSVFQTPNGIPSLNPSAATFHPNSTMANPSEQMGRRLLGFIHQWKLLLAQELVERGLQAERKSSESPKILKALK